MINQSIAKDNRIHYVIGSLAIVIGGLIYLIFRDDNLIMFSWIKSVGMGEYLNNMRIAYGDYSIYSWVRYNLPASLWLFSYLFIIKGIWHNQSKNILYYVFLSVIPIMAFGSELLQLLAIIPGTFDIADLVGYTLATIAFLITTNFKI